MRRTLSFVPAFQREASEAYDGYEEKTLGLGATFIKDILAKVARIHANPFLFPLKSDGLRRCKLRRFPYTFVYQTTDLEITLLGLFHNSRDPQAVSQALKARSS